MIFALWTAICCSVIIVLRFDGSLTPPRDPGCATIPARMATCSSSIAISLLPPSDQSGNSKLNVSQTVANRGYTQQRTLPLAIGSRSLELTMGMTSAHSEYEGLLLGLEWLLGNGGPTFWDNSTQLGLFEANQQSLSLHRPKESCILLIQGDCRTVIDQLSGRSVPRKLRPLYEKSQDLIQQLLQLKKNSLGISHVEYQHIPRHENGVCDGICGALMTIKTRNAEKALSQELQRAALIGNHTQEITGDNNNQFVIRSIISKHLAPSTSFIRFSVRPSLYKTMVALAEQHQEWETLIQIGVSMTTEARQIWPQMDKFSSARSELVALGVMCQIRGLESMKREKQAIALRRKHRILLHELPTMDQWTSTESNYDWDRPEETHERIMIGDLVKDSTPHQIRSTTCESEAAIDWNPILQRWFDQTKNDRNDTSTVWALFFGRR